LNTRYIFIEREEKSVEVGCDVKLSFLFDEKKRAL